MSFYEKLCELAEIQPLKQSLAFNLSDSTILLSEKNLNERITAGLHVFLKLALEDEEVIERIDKLLLDHYIARIDSILSEQLDVILHHQSFQALESLWTSLKYVTDRAPINSNIKLEILDLSKEDIQEDFTEATDITKTILYKHIYTQEYDTPGGEPITTIITDYQFQSHQFDINLLRKLATIAAYTHCPFIGSVNNNFFYKKTFDEVIQIDDLSNYMERSEYLQWSAFREEENSRYIGLTLPRFLLRIPYGEHQSIKSFLYQEQFTHNLPKSYLWGCASFAFASNLIRSFSEYGWTVNIRGPESGGKVENLLLHKYNAGYGLQTKIPTEILIPETKELEFANLGFIPLSYYKNSTFACFFSANSIQKPTIYDSLEATANSRINARLPYIFLSSRLGHYLKVLQRENIGSQKSREELEFELNRWLQSLVTRMNSPGPELIAIHPLREGKIQVIETDDNPGYYKINLHAIPHFQVEGIDVQLSLIAQLPSKNKI